MESINERMKQLRAALDMNQTDFGEKIGVAQTYLSQMEKGDRPVTDKIYKIVCLETWNGNKINESWFRDGIGEMFIKPKKSIEIAHLLGDVENMEDTDFKKRLISALARLDSDGWAKLELLIDMISEK